MTTTFKIADGDIVLSRSTGQVELVEDKAKLLQDIDQHLGQIDYPGAALDELVATVSDEYVIRAELSRRVRAMVNELQKLQDRYQFRYRTRAERIFGIGKLIVMPVSMNGIRQQTSYAFRLDVVSVAGGAPVTLNGQIE
jgi:hypothetical protein